MNNPQLVKCEQCYRTGVTIYLGSLSSQGSFYMRETHNFKKQRVESYICIHASSFTLIHDCGFTIKVESGIIIQEQASPILNG